MGKIFSAVLTNSPDLPEPDDYEAHFLHCIDYMRQAAMCAGDLAIEPRGENGQPGPVNLDNAFNGQHGEKSSARRVETTNLTLGLSADVFCSVQELQTGEELLGR